MTSDPFLDAVGRYWDEIVELAGPERADDLRRLLTGAAEPDPVEARAALADELLELLPAEHPLVSMQRSGVMFDIGIEPGVTAVELATQLRRLGDRIGIARPAPELDWFDRAVRRRLLELPALSPVGVSARGGDPNAPGLIRLPTDDGTVRLPEFQFGSDGAARDVVRTINEALRAGADPWGAACWWADKHARLGTAPRELLAAGHDPLLRAAAADLGDD